MKRDDVEMQATDLGRSMALRMCDVMKFPHHHPACNCGAGMVFRADHKPGCPFFASMIDELNACADVVGLLDGDPARWQGVLILLSTVGALQVINKGGAQ